MVTPPSAVGPLLPFLQDEGIRRFMEPCAGDHDLLEELERQGFTCGFAGDLRHGFDAREMVRPWFETLRVDAIISNLPWSKERFCPILDRLLDMRVPVWLLMYADWPHTRWAAPYLPACTHIVAVGRVRWIIGSRYTSKDNAIWLRFEKGKRLGPRFFGRDAPPHPLKLVKGAAHA